MRTSGVAAKVLLNMEEAIVVLIVDKVLGLFCKTMFGSVSEFRVKNLGHHFMGG